MKHKMKIIKQLEKSDRKIMAQKREKGSLKEYMELYHLPGLLVKIASVVCALIMAGFIFLAIFSIIYLILILVK